MEILDMQDFGKRTADIIQLFLGVDVTVSGCDIIHIRNQHQPAFFGFLMIKHKLIILFLDDFTDFLRMKLIKQRKPVF